jgi:hypothetical protein
VLGSGWGNRWGNLPIIDTMTWFEELLRLFGQSTYQRGKDKGTQIKYSVSNSTYTSLNACVLVNNELGKAAEGKSHGVFEGRYYPPVCLRGRP